MLQRALIHHLADPSAAFAEARRILKPGGTLLVQDRTMADVVVPASAQHLRGWFFELFPSLVDVEAARRPIDDEAVDAWLRDARLVAVGHHRLSRLADEICERIADTVSDDEPIYEIDHWTVWEAQKGSGSLVP